VVNIADKKKEPEVSSLKSSLNELQRGVRGKPFEEPLNATPPKHAAILEVGAV
jgi:hypothetical protein